MFAGAVHWLRNTTSPTPRGTSYRGGTPPRAPKRGKEGGGELNGHPTRARKEAGGWGALIVSNQGEAKHTKGERPLALTVRTVPPLATSTSPLPPSASKYAPQHPQTPHLAQASATDSVHPQSPQSNHSPLTLRGSALYTPSTSVQMVMCPLRNSAPMMVAEKSEPLRRSVVA